MVPSARASYDRWMTSTDPTGATDHSDPDARSVRVRAQELAPVLGDLDSNLRTIEAAIRDAVADGVQLLVLPELATSGYYLDGPEAARAVALPSDAPVFADWASLLPEDTVVVVGFCERDHRVPRWLGSGHGRLCRSVGCGYRRRHERVPDLRQTPGCPSHSSTARALEASHGDTRRPHSPVRFRRRSG